LAMGGVVPLPDALCVRFATDIAGQSPSTYPLAWALHVLTGVTFGVAFGILASITRVGGKRPMRRSVLLGLLSGGLVWAGFFSPSIAIFAPSLITDTLLETSLAAHVVFGLILGATLGIFLSRNQRHAN
jgi:membrane associated rhomboid family serine protease